MNLLILVIDWATEVSYYKYFGYQFKRVVVYSLNNKYRYNKNMTSISLNII